MEAEAVPAAVAQAVGEIQMLLAAGQTMEQDRRGTGRLAGAPVESAEEPGAGGLEGDAIHACSKSRHAAAPFRQPGQRSMVAMAAAA